MLQYFTANCTRTKYSPSYMIFRFHLFRSNRFQQNLTINCIRSKYSPLHTYFFKVPTCGGAAIDKLPSVNKCKWLNGRVFTQPCQNSLTSCKSICNLDSLYRLVLLNKTAITNILMHIFEIAHWHD